MLNLSIYLKNKANTVMNKSKIFAIAMILLMFISIFCIATAFAQTPLVPTTAWVSVSPNPCGVGQTLLCNGWVTPQPLTAFMGASNNVFFRTGYTFVFTEPNGNTMTVIKSSFADGSTYFTITPNQVGTWTVQLSWNGQGIENTTYAPCISPLFNFTVQNTPIPSWPDTPLPSGYWTFPIYGENRAWYPLAGDWLMAGFDSSKDNFNQYSSAPTTAHVLWANVVGLGGIMGGDEGVGSYTVSSTPIVIDGYAYYSYVGGTVASPNQGYTMVNCVNLNTGKTVWQQPINGTMYFYRLSTDPDPGNGASDEGIFTMPAAGTVYYYSPATGELSGTYVDPSAGISMYDGTAYFYYNNGTNLIKWYPYGVSPTTGATGTFTQRKVIWSVKYPTGMPAPTMIDTTTGIATNTWATVAYNLTDGSLLWNTTSLWTTTSSGAGQYHPPGGGPIVEFGSAYTEVVRDGRLYLPTSGTSVAAFDLRTGALDWVTPLPSSAYPYGSFWTYGAAVGDGLVYEGNYDGYMYAFNETTGAIAWSFYAGNSGTETAERSWSWWNNPALADNGIIIGGTATHLPNDPATRGWRLYAINVTNGNLVWSIAFDHNNVVVADGMVLAANIYDGKLYCFGKGPTATTVTATPGVANAVTIQGTVTDQSPGDPGAPCAADVDMTAWMEYLYMQQPLPTSSTSTYQYYPTGTPMNFTGQGVPVILSATAPDGTITNLGTTYTSQTGNYALSWTPPTEGLYTITAVFAGTNSYYQSDSQTSIAVGSLATPTPTATPTSNLATATDLMTYIVVAVIIIIIAIAIVGLLLLRKRP